MKNFFRSSSYKYVNIIYSPNTSNAYDEGKTKIIYIIVPQSASNDTVPAFQPNTTLAVVSIGPHVFHTMLDIAADTENNTSIYHRNLKKHIVNYAILTNDKKTTFDPIPKGT